jgi:hypothetical protein
MEGNIKIANAEDEEPSSREYNEGKRSRPLFLSSYIYIYIYIYIYMHAACSHMHI